MIQTSTVSSSVATSSERASTLLGSDGVGTGEETDKDDDDDDDVDDDGTSDAEDTREAEGTLLPAGSLRRMSTLISAAVCESSATKKMLFGSSDTLTPPAVSRGVDDPLLLLLLLQVVVVVVALSAGLAGDGWDGRGLEVGTGTRALVTSSRCTMSRTLLTRVWSAVNPPPTAAWSLYLRVRCAVNVGNTLLKLTEEEREGDSATKGTPGGETYSEEPEAAEPSPDRRANGVVGEGLPSTGPTVSGERGDSGIGEICETVATGAEEEEEEEEEYDGDAADADNDKDDNDDGDGSDAKDVEFEVLTPIASGTGVARGVCGPWREEGSGSVKPNTSWAVESRARSRGKRSVCDTMSTASLAASSAVERPSFGPSLRK